MTTLQAYRRAVAPRLHPYYQGTAATASTTAVLQIDTWPFKSTLEQEDLFSDFFLYRPSAAAAGDKTRTVTGYSPSLGQFTPDLAWTNEPDGETVEFHGIVPPVLDGVSDLHALINEALKTILLVVEVTGTPVADAQRHSLGTVASWLQEPSWVYEVGYLGPTEDRDEVDPYRRPVRGSAEIDGEVVYLNHPGLTLNPTDTVWVRLLKPAYHHCKASGGAYGGQAGLSLETDEAPVATEWVVAATLVQAWLRLGSVLSPGDAGRAEQERAKAAAQASRFQRNYLEAHRPRRTFRPVHGWGAPRWR